MDGYSKLCDIHSLKTFLHIEQDFQNEFMWIVKNGLKSEFTMLLVDDCVFVRPLDVSEELDLMRYDESIYSLAPRLSPQINYWYEKQEPIEAPGMDERYTWAWEPDKLAGGWRSFYSLDGNIFRTKNLKEWLGRLQFNTPNTLESIMRRRPLPGMPLMMCVPKPIIIGFPMNKVQTNWNTRNMGIPTEELNNQWLSGKRINLEPFLGFESNAVHSEIPIEMETF